MESGNFPIPALPDRYKPIIDLVVGCNTTRAKYHSTYHLLGVANITYELATHLCFDDRIIDRLVYSALFHDINHPQHVSDYVNVITSINSLYNYDLYPHITNYELDCIAQTIWVTRYPYDIKDEFEPYQYVLRDADLLYSTIYSSKELIINTYDELCRNKDRMNFQQWLKRNIQFLMNLKDDLTHNYSKQLYQRYIDKARLDNLDMFC